MGFEGGGNYDVWCKRLRSSKSSTKEGSTKEGKKNQKVGVGGLSPYFFSELFKGKILKNSVIFFSFLHNPEKGRSLI